MNPQTDWTTRKLEALTTLPVCNGAGGSVVCVTGELWITQEGDARDIIIGAGERFEVDSRGLTLVHALQPSVVRLHRLDSDALRACVEASAKRLRRAALADLARGALARIASVVRQAIQHAARIGGGRGEALAHPHLNTIPKEPACLSSTSR